jgi:hypothetical protein
MTSRRELYALGEPFGESATSTVYGKHRIYGGGGGSSPQPTTSITSPTIPDELKPLANLYVQQATDYSQTPFQSYGDQRYADLNQTQNMGIGMVQDRALNGDPLVNAGSGFLQNQLQSGPQSATQNPYGPISAGMNNGQLSAGVNNGFTTPGMNNTAVNAGTNNRLVNAADNTATVNAGMNTDRITAGTNTDTISPYMNTAMVQAGQNQYAGANPYLDAAVNRAQSSVVDQFNNMTKPQTEAAMRNSGSFGNSGLNQMMQIQQKAAGQQLGDNTSWMYMQDYGNQQQLAESAINRS